MNDELKQAFKVLSDYCSKQHKENCVFNRHIYKSNEMCELSRFCELHYDLEGEDIPADFYKLFVGGE